jgi:hypothetical protein
MAVNGHFKVCGFGRPLTLCGVTCAVKSLRAIIGEKEGFASHPSGAPLRPRDRADLFRLRNLAQARGKS